ncbi:hypothetical protein FNH05_20490, partial [Amycolatopsis rhizosphaerae]
MATELVDLVGQHHAGTILAHHIAEVATANNVQEGARLHEYLAPLAEPSHQEELHRRLTEVASWARVEGPDRARAVLDSYGVELADRANDAGLGESAESVDFSNVGRAIAGVSEQAQGHVVPPGSTVAPALPGEAPGAGSSEQMLQDANGLFMGAGLLSGLESGLSAEDLQPFIQEELLRLYASPDEEVSAAAAMLSLILNGDALRHLWQPGVFGAPTRTGEDRSGLLEFPVRSASSTGPEFRIVAARLDGRAAEQRQALLDQVRRYQESIPADDTNRRFLLLTGEATTGDPAWLTELAWQLLAAGFDAIPVHRNGQPIEVLAAKERPLTLQVATATGPLRPLDTQGLKTWLSAKSAAKYQEHAAFTEAPATAESPAAQPDAQVPQPESEAPAAQLSADLSPEAARLRTALPSESQREAFDEIAARDGVAATMAAVTGMLAQMVKQDEKLRSLPPEEQLGHLTAEQAQVFAQRLEGRRNKGKGKPPSVDPVNRESLDWYQRLGALARIDDVLDRLANAKVDTRTARAKLKELVESLRRHIPAEGPLDAAARKRLDSAQNDFAGVEAELLTALVLTTQTSQQLIRLGLPGLKIKRVRLGKRYDVDILGELGDGTEVRFEVKAYQSINDRNRDELLRQAEQQAAAARAEKRPPKLVYIVSNNLGPEATTGLDTFADALLERGVDRVLHHGYLWWNIEVVAAAGPGGLPASPSPVPASPQGTPETPAAAGKEQQAPASARLSPGADRNTGRPGFPKPGNPIWEALPPQARGVYVDLYQSAPDEAPFVLRAVAVELARGTEVEGEKDLVRQLTGLPEDRRALLQRGLFEQLLAHFDTVTRWTRDHPLRELGEPAEVLLAGAHELDRNRHRLAALGLKELLLLARHNGYLEGRLGDADVFVAVGVVDGDHAQSLEELRAAVARMPSGRNSKRYLLLLGDRTASGEWLATLTRMMREAGVDNVFYKPVGDEWFHARSVTRQSPAPDGLRPPGLAPGIWGSLTPALQWALAENAQRHGVASALLAFARALGDQAELSGVPRNASSAQKLATLTPGAEATIEERLVADTLRSADRPLRPLGMSQDDAARSWSEFRRMHDEWAGLPAFLARPSQLGDNDKRIWNALRHGLRERALSGLLHNGLEAAATRTVAYELARLSQPELLARRLPELGIEPLPEEILDDNGVPIGPADFDATFAGGAIRFTTAHVDGPRRQSPDELALAVAKRQDTPRRPGEKQGVVLVGERSPGEWLDHYVRALDRAGVHVALYLHADFTQRRAGSPLTLLGESPRSESEQPAVGTTGSDEGATVVQPQASPGRIGRPIRTEDLDVRELHELSELQAVFDLYGRIWEPAPGAEPISVEVLRALSHAGGPVLGAFLGDTLVGASVAFLGPLAAWLQPYLTGVAPEMDEGVVGEALSRYQHAWAQRAGAVVRATPDAERSGQTTDALAATRAGDRLHQGPLVPKRLMPQQAHQGHPKKSSSQTPEIFSGPTFDPPAAAQGMARHAAVSVLQLSADEDLQAVIDLFAQVWHPAPGAEPVLLPLLRALEQSGNYVAGAFVDGRLVGATVAFFGGPGGSVLHSHVTAVLPHTQGMGIGRILKLRQQEWARRHGAEAIQWTFNPLLRRNAGFNNQLGARPVQFLLDFYGELDDEANRGFLTDRVLVRWDITATPRKPVEPVGSEPMLVEDGEWPRIRSTTSRLVTVQTPHDWESANPKAAVAWQEAMRAVLGSLLAEGAVVEGFTAEGAYVVRRPVHEGTPGAAQPSALPGAAHLAPGQGPDDPRLPGPSSNVTISRPVVGTTGSDVGATTVHHQGPVQAPVQEPQPGNQPVAAQAPAPPGVGAGPESSSAPIPFGRKAVPPITGSIEVLVDLHAPRDAEQKDPDPEIVLSKMGDAAIAADMRIAEDDSLISEEQRAKGAQVLEGAGTRFAFEVISEPKLGYSRSTPMTYQVFPEPSASRPLPQVILRLPDWLPPEVAVLHMAHAMAAGGALVAAYARRDLLFTNEQSLRYDLFPGQAPEPKPVDRGYIAQVAALGNEIARSSFWSWRKKQRMMAHLHQLLSYLGLTEEDRYSGVRLRALAGYGTRIPMSASLEAREAMPAVNGALLTANRHRPAKAAKGYQPGNWPVGDPYVETEYRMPVDARPRRFDRVSAVESAVRKHLATTESWQGVRLVPTGDGLRYDAFRRKEKIFTADFHVLPGRHLEAAGVSAHPGTRVLSGYLPARTRLRDVEEFLAGAIAYGAQYFESPADHPYQSTLGPDADLDYLPDGPADRACEARIEVLGRRIADTPMVRPWRKEQLKSQLRALLEQAGLEKQADGYALGTTSLGASAAAVVDKFAVTRSDLGYLSTRFNIVLTICNDYPARLSSGLVYIFFGGTSSLGNGIGTLVYGAVVAVTTGAMIRWYETTSDTVAKKRRTLLEKRSALAKAETLVELDETARREHRLPPQEGIGLPTEAQRQGEEPEIPPSWRQRFIRAVAPSAMGLFTLGVLEPVAALTGLLDGVTLTFGLGLLGVTVVAGLLQPPGDARTRRLRKGKEQDEQDELRRERDGLETEDYANLYQQLGHAADVIEAYVAGEELPEAALEALVRPDPAHPDEHLGLSTGEPDATAAATSLLAHAPIWTRIFKPSSDLYTFRMVLDKWHQAGITKPFRWVIDRVYGNPDLTKIKEVLSHVDLRTTVVAFEVVRFLGAGGISAWADHRLAVAEFKNKLTRLAMVIRAERETQIPMKIQHRDQLVQDILVQALYIATQAVNPAPLEETWRPHFDSLPPKLQVLVQNARSHTPNEMEAVTRKAAASSRAYFGYTAAKSVSTASLVGFLAWSLNMQGYLIASLVAAAATGLFGAIGKRYYRTREISKDDWGSRPIEEAADREARESGYLARLEFASMLRYYIETYADQAIPALRADFSRALATGMPAPTSLAEFEPIPASQKDLEKGLEKGEWTRAVRAKLASLRRSANSEITLDNWGFRPTLGPRLGLLREDLPRLIKRVERLLEKYERSGDSLLAQQLSVTLQRYLATGEGNFATQVLGVLWDHRAVANPLVRDLKVVVEQYERTGHGNLVQQVDAVRAKYSARQFQLDERVNVLLTTHFRFGDRERVQHLKLLLHWYETRGDGHLDGQVMAALRRIRQGVSLPGQVALLLRSFDNERTRTGRLAMEAVNQLNKAIDEYKALSDPQRFLHPDDPEPKLPEPVYKAELQQRLDDFTKELKKSARTVLGSRYLFDVIQGAGGGAAALQGQSAPGEEKSPEQPPKSASERLKDLRIRAAQAVWHDRSNGKYSLPAFTADTASAPARRKLLDEQVPGLRDINPNYRSLRAGKAGYRSNCVVATSAFLYARAGWKNVSAVSWKTAVEHGRTTLKALWEEVGGTWQAHGSYDDVIAAMNREDAAALAVMSRDRFGRKIRHLTAVVVDKETGVPIFVDPMTGDATLLPRNPEAIYLLPVDLAKLAVSGKRPTLPADGLAQLPDTEQEAVYHGELQAALADLRGVHPPISKFFPAPPPGESYGNWLDDYRLAAYVVPSRWSLAVPARQSTSTTFYDRHPVMDLGLRSKLAGKTTAHRDFYAIDASTVSPRDAAKFFQKFHPGYARPVPNFFGSGARRPDGTIDREYLAYWFGGKWFTNLKRIDDVIFGMADRPIRARGLVVITTITPDGREEHQLGYVTHESYGVAFFDRENGRLLDIPDDPARVAFLPYTDPHLPWLRLPSDIVYQPPTGMLFEPRTQQELERAGVSRPGTWHPVDDLWRRSAWARVTEQHWLPAVDADGLSPYEQTVLIETNCPDFAVPNPDVYGEGAWKPDGTVDHDYLAHWFGGQWFTSLKDYDEVIATTAEREIGARALMHVIAINEDGSLEHRLGHVINGPYGIAFFDRQRGRLMELPKRWHQINFLPYTDPFLHWVDAPDGYRPPIGKLFDPKAQRGVDLTKHRPTLVSSGKTAAEALK